MEARGRESGLVVARGFEFERRGERVGRDSPDGEFGLVEHFELRGVEAGWFGG